MKSWCIGTLLLCCQFAFGQNWIDTSYTIQTQMDIHYGIATSFAGNQDSLKLDLSYPLSDQAPACGWPLMVIIHGGAWLGGDKNMGNAPRLRRDFAKRGYVTASVNYRLGLFHTDQAINCNVEGWNCFNMTDSSEWYRANHRAIQDVNGAIRFLVNQANDYQIDPSQTFLVGESAGGFVAMGVGFIDDASEVLEGLVAEYPDAPAPNNLYEDPCIQGFDLADNIASMQLSRPALGSYLGDLHLPLSEEFQIKAVGNIYGGAFNNIFQAFQPDPPALYLYHQPCDLIVPFNYSRLLAGYTNCLTGFPTNCGFIVNRPFAYGSAGIKNLIDNLALNDIPTSEYFFDNTSNNYNCFQQATNQSLVCHAIDNYWLRTSTMATYFAEHIDSCLINSIPTSLSETPPQIDVFPNPTKAFLHLEFDRTVSHVEIQIYNSLGQVVSQSQFSQVDQLKLDMRTLQAGLYFMALSDNQQRQLISFIKN